MSKLRLTPAEIHSIVTNVTTIRVSPSISYALSEKIDGLIGQVKPHVQKLKEQSELLNSRNSEIRKMEKGDAKTKALTELQDELDRANRQVIEVEIKHVSLKDFGDKLDVGGTKELLHQETGQKYVLYYRDAFFDLRNLGVIV